MAMTTKTEWEAEPDQLIEIAYGLQEYLFTAIEQLTPDPADSRQRTEQATKAAMVFAGTILGSALLSRDGPNEDHARRIFNAATDAAFLRRPAKVT